MYVYPNRTGFLQYLFFLFFVKSSSIWKTQFSFWVFDLETVSIGIYNERYDIRKKMQFTKFILESFVIDLITICFPNYIQTRMMIITFFSRSTIHRLDIFDTFLIWYFFNLFCLNLIRYSIAFEWKKLKKEKSIKIYQNISLSDVDEFKIEIHAIWFGLVYI